MLDDSFWQNYAGILQQGCRCTWAVQGLPLRPSLMWRSTVLISTFRRSSVARPFSLTAAIFSLTAPIFSPSAGNGEKRADTLFSPLQLFLVAFLRYRQETDFRGRLRLLLKR
jgi:hypothetical protein